MSKFIKVTDKETGWNTIIFTHRIAGIIPHHESGSVIAGASDGNIEVEESLEQIEAQLLRDEFAKAALQVILGQNKELQAKSAYEYADAMLKERVK